MRVEEGQHLDLLVGPSRVTAFYYQLGDPVRGDIIAMHTGGVGVSAFMCWYPNLDAFAQAGYRVTAPDAPGFGRTVVASGEGVRPTEFLLHLMDALEIQRTHLIGNSMGAMTISQFAVQRPDRVLSLVMSGGEPRVQTDDVLAIGSLAHTSRNDYVRAMFADNAVDFEHLRNATADFMYDRDHPAIDYVAKLRLDTLSDDGVYRRAEEGAFHQLERKPGSGSTDYIAEIQSPVFLLHGRDEPWFYAAEHRPALTDAAMKAAEAIPNCTATLLPHCGHWPQIELPDRYNALVLEFLASL